MTLAIFKRNIDSWEIDITGHAGYSTDGPDIVCSACSVLTCTLMQTLKAMEDKGAVVNVTDVMHSGDIKVTFDAERPEPHTAVHTIMEGFRLLADKYPRNVRYVFKVLNGGGADQSRK